MQEQVNYKSEVVNVHMGDRAFTIENLTPILSSKERERRKREIEKQLFSLS
ncbi:MAG: hypothetical protein FWD05_13890 [Oscillospiraceae bacterium]|nr:hypothetical protein [Oscillospiraceae bacterium]